jgi:hypothetical protein
LKLRSNRPYGPGITETEPPYLIPLTAVPSPEGVVVAQAGSKTSARQKIIIFKPRGYAGITCLSTIMIEPPGVYSLDLFGFERYTFLA